MIEPRIPVPERDTPGFGLLSMDVQSRVTGWVEKPKTPEKREPYCSSAEWIERRGIECQSRYYLANVGIYLFKTSVLYELLTAKPLATDFGKEVFPRNYKTKNICAHLLDGYWEDRGTVRSYHEASLVLAVPNPPFDFFAPAGVTYTRMRNLPASRGNNAVLTESRVADRGVIGDAARIERSSVGGGAASGAAARSATRW